MDKNRIDKIDMRNLYVPTSHSHNRGIEGKPINIGSRKSFDHLNIKIQLATQINVIQINKDILQDHLADHDIVSFKVKLHNIPFGHKHQCLRCPTIQDCIQFHQDQSSSKVHSTSKVPWCKVYVSMQLENHCFALEAAYVDNHYRLMMKWRARLKSMQQGSII